MCGLYQLALFKNKAEYGDESSRLSKLLRSHEPGFTRSGFIANFGLKLRKRLKTNEGIQDWPDMSSKVSQGKPK